MFHKVKSQCSRLSLIALQAWSYLSDRRRERGEESASVAAITGLVLLIILIVMAIFRNALIAAFNQIAGMLAF